ncbi:16S rRNA (cytidine(1402)-2'-O)-methyltransferase [Candidatus Gottesmanbacteria bacterium]|nr:16S rRNA (cytidine(1402)-2'-O)-methyltransferase [Candidatus Gottesmanbacteria bacterium]
MGILYIVATPIGNLEDITIHAVKILFTVDYIACEDTRNTGQLLANLESKIKNKELVIKNLGIKKPHLISYYDEIEFKRVPEIIELLEGDKHVALVSDSGTPLISDPGFKLVQECIKRKIKIISIPGPSSVITALTSSGLPPDKFLFLGFLPPKESHRKQILSDLLESFNNPKQFRPTIIFFEASRRLKESLEDLREVFGDLEITITRELTKIHEEVWRGKISQTILNFNQVKGELVILFKI